MCPVSGHIGKSVFFNKVKLQRFYVLIWDCLDWAYTLFLAVLEILIFFGVVGYLLGSINSSNICQPLFSIFYIIFIMLSSRTFALVCLYASGTFCQFNSYVPEYIADTPVQFIQSVPVIQPFDQFVSFKSSKSSLVAEAELNKVQDSTQNNVLANKFGLGFRQANSFSLGAGNGQSAVLPQLLEDDREDVTVLDSNFCKFPLVREKGVCKCPNNFRFIFGRCVIDNDISDNGKGQNIKLKKQQKVPTGGTVQCPVLKINKITSSNSLQSLALISRTFDGKDNNADHVDWGSAGALLDRRVRAKYADGIKEPINTLKGPRQVSNTLGSQSQPITKSRVRATIAFTIFGQFIDHDIDLTPAQRGGESFDIPIPPGDRFFANQPSIKFSRSQFVEKAGEPRRHPNVVTSWIDGSQVYGSSDATACALRTFSRGKLKVSKQRDDQFLPLFDGLFRAGDGRVLQNAILTSYHTIFVRQHNRICERVLKSNPNFNDETVFRIARNYVIALLQKITLKDFAPILLGDSYRKIIGDYRGYRNNIKPNIPTQFSTAGYRIGHTLLVNQIPTIDENGRVLKKFRLNELFFKQNLITSDFINNIMRGAAKTLTKEKSSQLVDDVRNLLVLDPVGTVKLDLFSLNIQRGRDHGLPTYNEARSIFGLPKIRSFEQLVSNDQIEIAQKLKDLYGNVNNIQLFVGIISQKPVRNGIVGQLGAEIVGQTFRNLRNADRLWYQRNYPAKIRRQIQSTQLGDIVKRNCEASDIPSNMFRLS